MTNQGSSRVRRTRRHVALSAAVLGPAVLAIVAAQGCGSDDTGGSSGAADAALDGTIDRVDDSGLVGPEPDATLEAAADAASDAASDAGLDAPLESASDVDAQARLPTVQVSTNDAGIKGFSAAGQPFVPIGVNDVEKVSARFPDDSGTYDGFDMFDTSQFDIGAVDSLLAAIGGNGFNYVRLWLKSADTQQGFSAVPGGLSAAQRWQAYVNDVVQTIHSAESHGLHVVLTGQFPGADGDTYLPLNYYQTIEASLPPKSQVDGYSRLLLAPAMATELGLFYHDLLTAMIAQDPGIRSSIFYIDMYNETIYDLAAPPLSSGSGSFVYGGTTYDLSDFSVDPSDTTSRQALMDRATQAFVTTVSTQIRDVMPDMLVTVSTGYNYATSPQHLKFDGGHIIDGGMPGNHYMLRPRFVLQGGADILDVHLYPSSTSDATTTMVAALATSDEVYPVDAAATATSVSALDAPLIAGEFDGNDGKFGFGGSPGDADAGAAYLVALDAGISGLRIAETNAFCNYGYTGFAFWNWNDVTPGDIDGIPVGTFPLVAADDPNGEMMHFIAPKYNPTFCGQTIAPLGTGH